MNVIYLVTKIKKGAGPINQLLNLATAFKNFEINFYVVCLSPEQNESWLYRFEREKIKVIHLNKKPWNILACVRALRKLIGELNIEIVHSSGLRPDLCNILVGSSVRHMTTQRCEVENIGEEEPFLLKLVMKYLLLFLLRKMDKKIACSYSLQHILAEKNNIKAEVIQNGVDVDKFTKISKSEKYKLREKLELPQNKTIYIYTGSLIPRKDVPTLLKAFMNLDVSRLLLVVGGLKEQVEQLSKKYKSNNILFVGSQSNPLPYIQCADYGISASLSEGLPNTVLEFIACGLPVILSDIYPHQEILQEKNIGLKFPCGNVESLKKNILLIDTLNYNELSDNCIALVNTNFSKYVTAANYLREYRSLLK